MAALLHYTFPLAFFPARTKLILEEKGVVYQDKIINLFNGQSLSPEYLRVNPQGTVPSLRDGDRLITQSREIVEYVDALGDGPLGGAAVDRALVNDWLTTLAWDGNLFAAANADKTLQGIFATTSEYKLKYAQARKKDNPDLAPIYESKIAGMKASAAESAVPANVQANAKELEGLLDKAEVQLAKTKFLAGDAYSAADAAFTPVLFRISNFKQQAKYLQPRPKVVEYYARIKSRPSYQAAFGVALSPASALAYVVPALVKAKVAKVTGWY